MDFPLIWRQVKIGAPASVRGTERATSQLVLLGLVSPFGDVALATYALYRRLEMFSNFANQGISQSTGTMVGQNLGAGKPDRAKQVVWWSCGYNATMNLMIRGLFWIFPVGIIMIFTKNADVVALTVQWVRIQLIAAFFQGLMQIFQEAFNGAGDTLAPMINTVVGVWAAEVPAAFYLCTQTFLGPLGIAVAAILGFSSRAFAFLLYYFYGRWLRVKVI